MLDSDTVQLIRVRSIFAAQLGGEPRGTATEVDTLMPHTYQVRDFVPRLATAVGRDVIGDCIG
jgi:hypothetical protein